MSTNRLEAFSDGVIAVAITLLVLNLPVPTHHPPGDLPAWLGARWPQFAAYVVSFLTIGIVWINHHSSIARLERGDHVVLVSNLLLLLTIVLLPFATNLMAVYLKASHGQHVAAAVYSGAFLLMSLAFSLLNWNVLMRRPDLLGPPLPERERRRIFRASLSGLPPYVVAVAIAPVSPYATLGICGVVAAFYALPMASGR